jgi:hypothetical protein
VGAEPGIGQIAAQVRLLMIHLRIRLTAPSPIGILGAGHSNLGFYVSSSVGRAHEPGFQGMTRSLEERGCAPSIDGEARALSRPEIL